MTSKTGANWNLSEIFMEIVDYDVFFAIRLDLYQYK
jgi:hypothetical protein